MNYLRLLLPLLLFYGCNKEKLKAPDAFFIKPQSITVSTTTLQGTGSHKITDLWYYVNNSFKGAFPTENTLPIPSSGQTQVLIYPGIKNNGISATRLAYEFYEPITIDTAIASGNTFYPNLIFKYKSAAVFKWVEDFEGFGTTSGITITKTNNSDTTFTILNKVSNPSADVFEGNRCFYFGLDANRAIGVFQSTALYNLPKGGAPVYLELNYKCTQPFEVGVYSTTGGYTYASSVNTSPNWNKIYIHLSTAVTTNLGSLVGLYFRSVKQVDNPEFFIDNIKIVSY